MKKINFKSRIKILIKKIKSYELNFKQMIRVAISSFVIGATCGIVLPLIFPTIPVIVTISIGAISSVVVNNLDVVSKSIFSVFKTIKNKLFKDRKNSNGIKNSKKQELKNNLKINNSNDKNTNLTNWCAREINSLDLQNQPSTSNGYTAPHNSPNM